MITPLSEDECNDDHLEKSIMGAQNVDMSNKEIVEDLLQRIPDDASLHDIAREIEFIAAVQQGLSELDRDERIPIEDVERELPSWIIR
jgi:predicted transcriptional regulator